MLHCERGTSVFFPPIDKFVQVYSCRIVEFFSCPRIHNKKLQKSICCRDDCVGPPIKKLESVCIGTDSLPTPTTILYSSEIDETNKENMYRGMGGDETMIHGELPPAIEAKLSKRGKQTDYIVQDTKKKYRRRKRSSRASKGVQSCKNPTCLKSEKTKGIQSCENPTCLKSKKTKGIQSCDNSVCFKLHRAEFTPNDSTFVNTKQDAIDKKSLISIFRKKKKINKNQECQCPLETNTNTLRDQNNKHENAKMNIKFEVKPKSDQKYPTNVDKDVLKNVLVEKKCYEGICSKESKKKAKDFVCTCLHKKEPGVICSDDTCGMMNLSSFNKLKDRAWYLCRKSWQKLGVSHINDTNKICDEGKCKEAFSRKNPNISCICKEKIKQCSDETCVPKKAAQLEKQTCRSMSKLCKIFQIFSSRRNRNLKNVVLQNEMEQTGDPLFEIKVNEIGMCVLNPSEIKDKVNTLGEIKKRECICPSHAALKQKILERQIRVTRPCKIRVKNKKTDFSCECLKNKILMCTDTCSKTSKVVTFSNNKDTRIKRDGTRDDSVDRNVTNTGTNKLYDKPLFEVKLDKDRMCIINSNEIQHNIHNWNKKNVADKNACILCKCCTGMESGECTEQTYRDATDTKRYCICGNRHTKMVRNGFDTASIKVIKSKISVFCNRMCSKSENLIKGSKKNKLRTRKTLLGTQSENVHKRDGLKIHINKKGKRRRFVMSNTAPNAKNRDQDIKDTTIKKVPNRIPYFSLFPESRKTVKNINLGKSENSKTAKSTRINKKKSKNEEKSLKPHPMKTPSKNEKKSQKQHPVKTPSKNEKKSQKPHPVKEPSKKEKKSQKPPPVKTPSPKVSKKPLMTKIHKKKKKTPAECVCQHICACEEEMKKTRQKARPDKKLNKLKHKGSKKKKQTKKKPKKKNQKKKKENLKYAAETKQKRKELLKEKKQLLKEEAQRQKLQKKEDREVMKLLESEGGASKNNCFVEILASVASLGFAVVKVVLFALFSTVFTPVKTCRYVRHRCEDPTGTWLKIKKETRRGWTMRKLRVCKCFKNSEKGSIIADAFKESAIYNTFVDKGKTKKEQDAFELEAKTRKKRVRQRREAALYGCRHALLTTLRKTPCLWVYHVCPNYYPQCLRLISTFKQLGHIFLFTLAFACWTPCIVVCEVTRAICCCLLCTG